MKMKKIWVLSLLVVFFLSEGDVFAQKKGKKLSLSGKGSELKFVFKGVPDTLLYLATYYTDKNFMYDTLYLSEKEPYTFVMKKDTLMPRGVYLLAGQNKSKYVDIIIDTTFSFTAVAENLNPEALDIVSNIRFLDSPENQEMIQFMVTMSNFQRRIYAISKNIKEQEDFPTPDKTLIEQYREDR